MKYEIVYHDSKPVPYGIRDIDGYLLFFSDIIKYPDQEERYVKEVSKQVELANYLLECLNKDNNSGLEYIPFDYDSAIAHNLTGRVVKNKTGLYTGLIVMVNPNQVQIGSQHFSYQDLFDKFVFIDKFLKTFPCGVPLYIT